MGYRGPVGEFLFIKHGFETALVFSAEGARLYEDIAFPKVRRAEIKRSKRAHTRTKAKKEKKPVLLAVVNFVVVLFSSFLFLSRTSFVCFLSLHPHSDNTVSVSGLFSRCAGLKCMFDLLKKQMAGLLILAQAQE